jgi:hypothetical protein
VASADLNGDGARDLVFSRTTDPFKIKKCDPTDCNSRDRSLFDTVVLLQDPLAPGVFLVPSAYELAGKAAAVVIADLDDDGYVDVGATQGKDGSVGVLRQDPALPGLFPARVDVPAVANPLRLAAGDLDGDHLTDLVVADKNSKISQWPYVRYQDAGNPGAFLEPVTVQ